MVGTSSKFEMSATFNDNVYNQGDLEYHSHK